MTAYIDQKIKCTNSHRDNFLVIPQSSDKTWEYPPQIAGSGDTKTCFDPRLPLLLQLKFYYLFVLQNTQFIMPALQSPHCFGPTHALSQAPAVARPSQPDRTRGRCHHRSQQVSRRHPSQRTGQHPPRPPPPPMPRVPSPPPRDAPPPSVTMGYPDMHTSMSCAQGMLRHHHQGHPSGRAPDVAEGWHPAPAGSVPARPHSPRAAHRGSAGTSTTSSRSGPGARPPPALMSPPPPRPSVLHGPGASTSPWGGGGRGAEGRAEPRAGPAAPGGGRLALPPGGRDALIGAAGPSAPPGLSPSARPLSSPGSARKTLSFFFPFSLFSLFFFLFPRFPGTTPFLPRDTASAPARQVARLIRAAAVHSPPAAGETDGRIIYDSRERRLDRHTCSYVGAVPPPASRRRTGPSRCSGEAPGRGRSGVSPGGRPAAFRHGAGTSVLRGTELVQPYTASPYCLN